ncbi:hypothetical protein [Streptomyces sp. t39]|uniref:hypothetical protein n=1 Tax=Streptomyces sp. t39 TaxID=1828156 RepID=UPI00164FCDFE|nr:hypothetical protein [Streptomyces sp. t39]
MTQNSSETRHALHAGSRESNAVVAGTTVPQLASTAHQDEALFAADRPTPIARPVPVQTSGRLEFAARCPQCKSWHRHIGLGEKDAPCGAHYLLEFKGAA